MRKIELDRIGVGHVVEVTLKNGDVIQGEVVKANTASLVVGDKRIGHGRIVSVKASGKVQVQKPPATTSGKTAPKRGGEGEEDDTLAANRRRSKKAKNRKAKKIVKRPVGTDSESPLQAMVEAQGHLQVSLEALHRLDLAEALSNAEASVNALLAAHGAGATDS